MTGCLKKENLDFGALSIGSSSGNAPKISEQESFLSYKPSQFALMYQDQIPPWSMGVPFEPFRHKLALSKDPKTNRKLDEQPDIVMIPIEDHNREEFSNQLVKKEHKESTNLICTNDQYEPMLLSPDTSVPDTSILDIPVADTSVPVRDDHNWRGRLYKKVISAENNY
ncbi:5318_t:CDS:2, partial [Gigaspora rosea]